MKSEARKKLSAAKKQSAIDNCLLKVGQKVVGRWDNDDGTTGWYDGTIVSINYERKAQSKRTQTHNKRVQTRAKINK